MNIWVAASDNNIEAVKKFIENGQTPNDKDPNGYTCMHAAASYGHCELLDYLVSVGGNVNITDEEGDTPLHVIEDVKTAKHLVNELKADWRIKNEDDQTPLQKIDDEDEFPEIVDYLKTLLSEPEQEQFNKDREEMPEGFDHSQLRYKMEDVDLDDTDPEQRKRIEEILNSSNPEEGLRQLVSEAMDKMHPEDEEEEEQGPSKKARR